MHFQYFQYDNEILSSNANGWAICGKKYKIISWIFSFFIDLWDKGNVQVTNVYTTN